MTEVISRDVHDAKYEAVVVHGPLLISVGWLKNPRFDPKNGQEMIGPIW